MILLAHITGIGEWVYACLCVYVYDVNAGMLFFDMSEINKDKQSRRPFLSKS